MTEGATRPIRHGQVGVADDEYYRTLSLVAVVNGQIIEVVRCCTGNWSEATRAGYYAEHGADAAPL